MRRSLEDDASRLAGFAAIEVGYKPVCKCTNIATLELQKNEPKPLKTRSRAQNRVPFDKALGDFGQRSAIAPRGLPR